MEMNELPQYNAGKPITDSSLRGWMGRRRGAIFAVMAALLALDIFAILYFQVFSAAPPGGLDGCFVDADGQPIVGATVRVGEYQTATYPDGCFFFAELPAGPHDLAVTGADGETLFSRAVDIPPDDAFALETVTLP